MEGREGEKHQCVVASHAPPTGDLAHNPGTCPDWEWKQQLFDSQAPAQSPTEPHQPGVLHSYQNNFSRFGIVLEIFATVVLTLWIFENFGPF